MTDNLASIFHTMSISEFHDSFLRLIMASYVSAIKGGCKKSYQDIMNDNKLFQDSVHSYKNVVTNYYAAKEELWLSSFMNPVYDVVDIMISHEFGKSRGAIHGHGAALCAKKNDSLTQNISNILADLADDTVKAVMRLDEFIENTYVNIRNEISPLVILDKDAMKTYAVEVRHHHHYEMQIRLVT